MKLQIINLFVTFCVVAGVKKPKSPIEGKFETVSTEDERPGDLPGSKRLPGVTAGEEDSDKAARQRGYAMGVTGEFFRYKHLFMKQPTDKDRDEAMDIASKIRCDVCQVVVKSLISKAKSFSEDDLAEQLEGVFEYQETGEVVHDRMMAHKKGCNKHFKDEVVAEGWTLRVCKDVVPGRNDSDPCLHYDGSKPNQQSVDTYELWKEGVFFACEQTVARHNDAIAAYLAEALIKEGDRQAVVREACEVHASCLGRPKVAPAIGEKTKEKKRRRRRSAKGNAEL